LDKETKERIKRQLRLGEKRKLVGDTSKIQNIHDDIWGDVSNIKGDVQKDIIPKLGPIIKEVAEEARRKVYKKYGLNEREHRMAGRCLRDSVVTAIISV